MSAAGQYPLLIAGGIALIVALVVAVPTLLDLLTRTRPRAPWWALGVALVSGIVAWAVFSRLPPYAWVLPLGPALGPPLGAWWSARRRAGRLATAPDEGGPGADG